MIYWIIGIIVYLAIAALTYKFVVSKWTSQNKFEKIWISLAWFALLPLYGIKKLQEL